MLKRIHFSLKHHICTLIFRSLLHPHLYLGLWKMNLKNSVTLLTLMVRLKDTLFDFKGLIQIKQSIQEIYMLWRRVWGPSFQNRSPFNLFSPSNSGLQGPPFQPLNIIVCRRFEPSPSMDNPLYGHPPFYVFFPNPSLLARLLHQYCPNKMPDKLKKKLIWQNYFFIFRKLKSSIKCFFYKQHFYEQHQAEI